LLLGLVKSQVWGQREPMYSQYMYNIGSFNAAYVGTVEKPDVSLVARTQWMGFPGYNNTLRFGANLPLGNERNGLGLNIISDKIGPTSQTFVDVAYSYQVQLSEDTRLSFGLEAGGSFLNTDFTLGTFENPGEPILNSQIVNSIYPTLGAGIFMYDSNWYLGLSVPNILGDAQYNPEVAQIVDGSLQYNFIGGHVFQINESLKFKPAFLINIMKGAPVVTNVSANFLLMDKLTLGTSYRFGNAISALAGFQLSDSFFAGYSYDYNTNGLSGFNAGSHEIILKFYLGGITISGNKRDSGANKNKGKQIDSPRFF
jgi:type IX secretion system PorP/SprF family membrane protein